MTEEQYDFENDLTLENIAISKGHEYASSIASKVPMKYERQIYADAKRAFTDGFLAGMAYKFTGE